MISATSSNFLRRELPAFGVQNPTILADATKQDIVDYLDLVPGGGGRRNDGGEILPDAVGENQGRPLLYVVDKTHLSHDANRYETELRQLRRVVGSRGQRAYLGVLEPGQLSVFPVSLSAELPTAQVYRAGTDEALTFFSRLTLGEYRGDGEPESGDYVYDEMFALLRHAADELTGTHGLDKGDVLSLVGRALFFRFLCDRRIVRPGSLRAIAPEAESLTDCFTTPATSASTCQWLDDTFNGDFLPLTDHGAKSFFERLNKKTDGAVFGHLSAILEGHEPAGAYYQMKLDIPWAKFDFAHVPVGLLSQVYEAFSWKWSPDAKGTSVHYTPRRIADYLVEEAFHSLANPESARVLDPACGAGVFLVLAFRRLYQARWKAKNQRPDTKAIREILENQLTGFDVSEPALRLAALSLYLTAIELDPEPIPPSKLAFKNVRGRVLFNFRRDGIDADSGPVIGSLGKHVGTEHNAAYDVVLCNPPWTSLEAEYKPLASEFTKLIREVLLRRGFEKAAKEYQNPDNVPDLPFVWRATDWCKPDGRIGMVLPSRNLFKQEPTPRRAREALFNGVAVTGILNCSNLSDTKVWPEMNQPFFLMFACNRKPKNEHRIRWVTPHCDVELNRRGELRIDHKSIELVSIKSAAAAPWLWKALSIGTSLDVEVIRRMRLEGTRPLLAYWKKDLKLSASNGYSVKIQGQEDATFMRGLPNLTDTSLFRFAIDVEQLPRFARPTLGRPRKGNVYKAPLALVKGFPGLSREAGWAQLSFSDVAFKQNWFGYSGAGHDSGDELVRYLHLFVHSFVWMHLVLLKSPKIGVERREFYKTDLDECPFVPLESLTKSQRAEVNRLSSRLLNEDLSVFNDIDTFFASLFGLNKHDVEVIRDTLETALPYSEVRDKACRPPTADQRRRFVSRVTSLLRPFVRKHQKEILAEFPEWLKRADGLVPYSVVLFRTEDKAAVFPEDVFFTDVIPLAIESGSSRVIFEADNAIAVAVLNQYRYWTVSRARLCAAEILNRHMKVFT